MAKAKTNQSANQTEKVVTKYDLKKKRREEEARREKRNAFISKVIGVALLAIIVISVVAGLSSRYYRINKEYVVVNGESVSEIEFDFYYGIAKSNILNSYGTYLTYYYGYDSSTSDKLQSYSDDQTWFDYFGSIAIDTIKSFKAILTIADEKGYEYTTYEDDLAEFKSSVEESAEEDSITVAEYYKQNFGSVVTEEKLEKYLYNYLRAVSARETLSDELTPSDSETESYYSQNKDDYDTVDYRSLEITATDASDSAALEAASNKADAMEAAITDEASFIQLCTEYADEPDDYKNDSTLSLTSDYSYSSSGDDLDEWLFDSSRAAGDTQIFTDSTSGSYTVVYFVERKSGYEDNKEDISDTVLSTKLSEAISAYADTYTVNTKKRVTLISED